MINAKVKRNQTMVVISNLFVPILSAMARKPHNKAVTQAYSIPFNWSEINSNGLNSVIINHRNTN